MDLHPTSHISPEETRMRYVSCNGDDTADGTINRPWATLDHAATTARPGDTVLVREGIYRINHAVKLGAARGTADEWITIRSHPGERAVFDAQAFKATGEGQSPDRARLGAIDISGARFLRVVNLSVRNSFGEGFRISGGSEHVDLIGCASEQTYKSGIAAWGIGHGGARHIRVIHCHVTTANDLNMALPADGGPGGRREAPHEAISIAGVHHFEVGHCRVHRCHKEGIDIKERSAHGIVHHNETHDLPRQGIYLDAWFGILEDVEVHSNFTHHNEWGIAISAEDDKAAMRNIRIHSNAVYNNRASGILFGLFGKDQPRSNVRIYNNTVVGNGSVKHWHGSTGGIDLRSANVRDVWVVNNIVVDNAGFELAAFAPPGTRADTFAAKNIVVRHNLTSPCHDSVKEVHDGWGHPYPLPGEDTIECDDAGFVMRRAADFRLRPGSPGLNAAKAIDADMIAQPHLGAFGEMPVYAP